MNIYGNTVGHPLPDPRKGMTMSGPINMNGQPISGLNAPTADDQAANMGYVNQQVRKAAHRNLLDNSDFRNPVNQRGQTTYTDVGYTIDRWRTWETGNVYTNLDADVPYIYPTAILHQYLAIDVNKPYTLAVKGINGSLYIVSGIPSVGVDNEAITLNAYNGNVQIMLAANKGYLWAALYEGEYSAETLPEYQPKGYMVEALNCGALTVHKTLDIPASGWSSTTPYAQTVSLEGVSAEDVAHVSPIYSETLATALAQQEAWGMVSRAKTAANAIMFYCFDEKPTTDISVQIEVNR